MVYGSIEHGKRGTYNSPQPGRLDRSDDVEVKEGSNVYVLTLWAHALSREE